MEERTVRIAVVGAGAFGIKHLEALRRIDEVEIAAIVSRRLEQAKEVAATFGVPVATTELDAVLGGYDVDAVILALRPSCMLNSR